MHLERLPCYRKMCLVETDKLAQRGAVTVSRIGVDTDVGIDYVASFCVCFSLGSSVYTKKSQKERKSKKIAGGYWY